MTDRVLLRLHRLVERTGQRKGCTTEDLLWRFTLLDLWTKGHRIGRPIAEVSSRFGKCYQAGRKWIIRFDRVAAMANNGSLPIEASNIELVQCREKSDSIASV